MKSLIYEKILNHKRIHHDILDYLEINHLKINFRTGQSESNLLLNILNLCLLEKIFGNSYVFLRQKKNIRKFASPGSVIGGSVFIKSMGFIKDFFYFHTTRNNLFFFYKKKNLSKFERYNNFVYLHFSIEDFISFSSVKLSKSNWETLSYLYDKQIYGLDVSIALNTRFYLFNKLLLSSHGVYVVEKE